MTKGAGALTPERGRPSEPGTGTGHRPEELKLSLGAYKSKLSGGPVQPVVEGGDVPPGRACGEEDTTVGEPQLGTHPQLGEATGCVNVEGYDLHTELPQRTLRQVGPPCSGRPDQHLGQGQGTCSQRFVDRAEQQPGGTNMMQVVRIEMSNQHAGVEHDHAGHSWRRASRKPGS